jgi:ABC-type phosphate transport system substrate-binding protein
MTVRAARLAAAVTAACLLGVPGAASAAPAGPPVAEILGSGSTWAQNAVDQWIANVQAQGVNVVFDGTGSAAGRQAFASGTVDFGVSDIGYQGNIDGQEDTSARPYAYLPITAGGTSFPYNIVVGGRRITNLRLSGETLAKIFTNQITNWDNSAITDDNNHHALPSLPIITVVPSEGSGTSAMFTEYLNQEFPSLWKSFNDGQSGMTEYWPRQGPNQVAQDGSSQVMNYIEAPAANGSIGIDEYSYPLSAGFPVAQIENEAGYFTLPSEYNVAVALTQAQINYDQGSIDYLLENLDNVYNYSDPRTYPLSSYSYTIMPTSPTDPTMKKSGTPAFPAKAQALAEFLDYSICEGQEYIGPIGYSALPVNLVEAGFGQIQKIAAAAPQVQISNLNILSCHNPTFVAGRPDANYLAQIAPEPPLCDKVGYGPCVGVLNANNNNGLGSTGSSSGAPPTSASAASAKASAASKKGKGSTAASQSGANAAANAAAVTGVTTLVPAGQGSSLKDMLAALALLVLVIALAAPPLLARRRWSLRRRQP